MAYIDAVWIVEIALELLADAQKMKNIFHIDPHEAPSSTLMGSIGDLVEAWFVGGMIPLMSSGASLTGWKATDLTSEEGAVVNHVVSPAEVGEIAVDPFPNNVAVCGTWYTLLRGRSYRGRTYFTGFPEDLWTASTLDLADASGIAAVMDDLLDDLDAEGWDLVVTSYRNNGAAREHAVSTPIVSASVDIYSDSQRRRLPGRGE